MKKILIVFTIVIANFSLALAAWESGSDFDKIDFRPSGNVNVDYAPDTNNQAFYIVTKHVSGNRVFGTTNATSKVYYEEDDAWKGVSEPSYTSISAGASEISGGNWTEL